jgi:urea transport system permease protein
MIGQMLDIVTTAAILYVVAVGLLIVFGVMKIINFAHSGFLAMGAYSALIVTHAALNPWLSLPLAFLAGFTIGAVVERVIVVPLYRRPLDAILATWGLTIVIGESITIAFGRGVQFVQSPITGAIEFLGETYSLYRLLLVAAAIVIAVVLALIINGTSLGLSTRGVIMNEDLSRALGINSDRIRLVTFSIGAGLASLAGALITPLSSVDPNMGVPWLVNAFMLVLVSGASLVSLAIAALVLGGAQVLVSAYVNSVLGGMTIVVVAAVLLRFRPQGLTSG